MEGEIYWQLQHYNIKKNSSRSGPICLPTKKLPWEFTYTYLLPLTSLLDISFNLTNHSSCFKAIHEGETEKPILLHKPTLKLNVLCSFIAKKNTCASAHKIAMLPIIVLERTHFFFLFDIPNSSSSVLSKTLRESQNAAPENITSVVKCVKLFFPKGLRK